MRLFFFSFLLLNLTQVSWGYPPLPRANSEEEALFVRRILEFWRDKEYGLVEAQLLPFLEAHPQSPYVNHFWAMLGDIALHEKAYTTALRYYDKIHQDAFTEEIQLKKWQALYGLNAYTQLYQQLSTLAMHAELKEEARFFYAEACLRQALTLQNRPDCQQEAQHLLEEALPWYESLCNSQFSSHARIGMAEIYRLLNLHDRAANIYLELATHEENEEILFHAASLLMQSDKQQACNIFKKIAYGTSNRTSDAAYQWLLLLAEGKHWETIANERTLLISCIEASRLPVCYFYLGLVNFEHKHYAQAMSDLQKCIRHSLPPQHEKTALYTLLMSAKELKKWEVCEDCFDELETRFPENRLQTLWLLASSYQQGKEHNRALKLYEHLIKEFPESEFAEKATLEKIRSLAFQKKYSEGHAAAYAFLEKYSRSPKHAEVLRLAIDMSLKQMEEGEEVCARLASDIERGIAAKVFSQEEQHAKELLLAKTYLKLGRINAAIQLLDLLQPSDPFLLMQCYLQEGTSPEKVILYGEEALKQHPEEKALCIHLFNAYLELSKEWDEKECARLAAEHLNAAIDYVPISLENRLWLAHYFAKDHPSKAIPLLNILVEEEAQLKRFDREALLLASLYMDQKKIVEAEAILEKVAQFQQKTEEEAKLKLAEIYVVQGKNEKAITLFQTLENAAQLTVAYAARLQLARLEFGLDPEKSLKKMLELASRKVLASEPVHLEAALDYAELRASSYPIHEQPMRYLELLLQMKALFTQQEDIWSKDYHAGREIYPEKDLLYQAYMRFIDARIYALQARLTHDPIEKKTKLNAARALFSTLRHGKYAVSMYIKERAITAYEN